MPVKFVQPDDLGADFTVNSASQKITNDCIVTGTATPTANPPEPTKKWLFINTTSNQATHYWNGIAWVSITGGVTIDPNTNNLLTTSAAGLMVSKASFSMELQDSFGNHLGYMLP